MLERMTNFKNEDFANCLYGNLNEASIIRDCIKKIETDFPDTYKNNKKHLTYHFVDQLVLGRCGPI